MEGMCICSHAPTAVISQRAPTPTLGQLFRSLLAKLSSYCQGAVQYCHRGKDNYMQVECTAMPDMEWFDTL